jgi:hypothetical protein
MTDIDTDKLSRETLDDLTRHLCDRVSTALTDTLQLVDHPRQRAVLAKGFAAAAVMVAAQITRDAYLADTGKQLSHKAVTLWLLRFCREMAEKQFGDEARVN